MDLHSNVLDIPSFPVQYFVFMQFLAKCDQIMCWHPFGVGSPLREILDPLLYFKIYSQKLQHYVVKQDTVIMIMNYKTIMNFFCRIIKFFFERIWISMFQNRKRSMEVWKCSIAVIKKTSLGIFPERLNS